MSTSSSLVRVSDPRLVASHDPKIKVKTKHRHWIMALSLLLMPAMVQQAEARKPKKKDYCIEHGCTGDKCICCER